MVKTTRAQRVALKRVFNRGPITTSTTRTRSTTHVSTLTYWGFRKRVEPTFGCDGAVVVPWCGMWLCIERDGYTHS
jgi:hypothetical protein